LVEWDNSSDGKFIARSQKPEARRPETEEKNDKIR
jgi:hypothetical protein